MLLFSCRPSGNNYKVLLRIVLHSQSLMYKNEENLQLLHFASTTPNSHPLISITSYSSSKHCASYAKFHTRLLNLNLLNFDTESRECGCNYGTFNLEYHWSTDFTCREDLFLSVGIGFLLRSSLKVPFKHQGHSKLCNSFCEIVRANFPSRLFVF